MTNIQNAIGVVVGRFQTPDLHAGHRHLLDTVQREQGRLLVILGVTGGQPTAADPLDAATRAEMILERYPDAIVRTIEDRPSNRAWSEEIDRIVAEAAPSMIAKLYGSRDSFTTAYVGTLPIAEVAQIPFENATEKRAAVAKRPLASRKFRRGVIYAAANRFPTSYQVVDAVIFRRETGEILLGRKAGDDGLRFIGGFVDPKDASLEAAAKREAFEETDGMETGAAEYVGSARINDHRYRKGPDAVMTAAFLLPYVFGALTPADDMEHLEWVRIEDVGAKLMSAHEPIWALAKNRL